MDGDTATMLAQLLQNQQQFQAALLAIPHTRVTVCLDHLVFWTNCVFWNHILVFWNHMKVSMGSHHGVYESPRCDDLV